MTQDIEGRKAPTHTGFRRWHSAKFTTELLPIIPPTAELRAGSTIRPEYRGKTPGVQNQDGTWSGLGGKWSTEFKAELADVKRWQAWGASVGLQGRDYPGLDIDVDDMALADTIGGLATEYLGFAPTRFRTGSPRRLRIYKGAEPIRKHRLAFTLAGAKHAVELLGTGQQYVVEGPHPKGGEYTWDEHPCGDAWAGALTEIDGAKIERFFGVLGSLLAQRGAATEKESAVGVASQRKSLDDASLHAPSPALVLEALKAWRPEHMAHDEYVLAIAAIKAALGPRREEFKGEVLEWSPGPRSGEPDEFDKRWDSVTDASLGWDWVASQARSSGFTGDAQADFDDGEAPSIPITPLEKMAARYVWVSTQERYVDLETGAFLAGKAFNAANTHVAPFGKSGVSSAEAEFQNFSGARKLAATTYRPGKPVIFKEGNASVVNLWRPSGRKVAEGVRDTDVEPWLDHVAFIFGDPGEEGREHFLNYCAHLLQRPGVKINHAPVILGEQGVGKDTSFFPVVEFIGSANVKNIGVTELESSFNDYLLHELVIVEEMHSFTRREIYNKLKGYIAAPPAFLPVNLKNQKPFTVPNVQNWIFYTNYDDAIAIDHGDRRFWVHRALADVKRPDAYYSTLYRWYADGGIEKIAGWLKARDISKFNPHAAPPMTQAKREMIDASAPPATRWLAEALSEGGEFNGRELIASRELVNYARGAFGPVPAKVADQVREQHAVAALKSAGFRSTERKVKIDGLPPVRLWTLKSPSIFDNLEHRFLLKRYTEDTTTGEEKRKGT